MAEHDSVIPAGGSGTLKAKIKTTQTQSGPVSKSISVTTDSPQAQRLVLSVTFSAVTAVAVLPRPQINLNGTKGEVRPSILVFHRADGQKLEITGVENGNDLVVITTRPVTEETVAGNQKAQPGDVLVEASVAPGTAAIAKNGILKIKTNHPDAKVIDLPYTVRVRPVIEARPSQVRLVLQDGNASARSALLRIQNNLRGQFKITGIKPSNPKVFRTQLLDGDVNQQMHTLAVMLEDDVAPGSLGRLLSESLVVTTDSAEQPELVVPVLIESKELRRPGQARPVE